MSKVLMVTIDFSTWEQAKAWSYTGAYSFFDGMKQNGVDCDLAPVIVHRDGSLDLRFVEYFISQQQRYSQVWVWCVHARYHEKVWTGLQSLSDVVVGVLMETLTFTDAELTEFPHLSTRQDDVLAQLRYCSHALTCNHTDAQIVQESLGIPAQWYPAMISEEFISIYPLPEGDKASFIGSCYGERKAYLKTDKFSQCLQRPYHLERDSHLPADFDACMAAFPSQFNDRDSCKQHLERLITVRRALFSLHLESMRIGFANVNLPSILKAYPGRVIEAMAVSSPVICWQPMDPEQVALFSDGEDIAFFKSPVEFLEKVTSLQQCEELREKMTIEARNKLLVRHTARIRIAQLNNWLADGVRPAYNSDNAYRPDIDECLYYKAFFTEDSRWSTAEPNQDESARWSVIQQYVNEIVPTRATFVEVGCGRGWLANLLSQYGDVTAVDPVADVIAFAEKLFPHISFLTGDAGVLAMSGMRESFDVLVCSEVLEHVPYAYKDAFISTLVSLVKPGGHLILSTPRKDILEQWTERYGIPGQPTEDWVTESEMQALLQANNCERLALQRAYLMDIYQIGLFQKK